MNNDLRKQIYNNLNLKETDDLINIWQKNDRVEWTEDTFIAIEEILQERLGEFPPQNKPIWSYEDLEDSEGEPDRSLLIDENNPPEFYDPHEVLRLEKWINKAAIASIAASVVSNLLDLPQTQRIVLSYFGGDTRNYIVAWLIAIVLFAFIVGLQSIIIYFPLKALGFLLKILMGMEFNSRGVAKKA